MIENDGALVAVIDDDEAICGSIARLLGAQGYRVQTYTNPREYLDESDAISPACVLVDIRMPDLDGLELFRATRAGGVEVPTIFMTATGDIPVIVEAMKEGAIDLLAKPFTASALGEAIHRATESAGRTNRDRRAIAGVWRAAERLTPREAEVCGLVACGLLNKRVAAIIGTKEKTVKVHRGRVMQKLGVPSLAGLVRLVDTLVDDADRTSMRLDGLEIARPRSAEIIVDVVARERAGAQVASIGT
jgi:FixJ family two-component response regulator